MPVNIYTSHNDRVVHTDYVDPWSVTDLLATIPEQKALCERFKAPVIIVVDLLGTQRIPPGVIRGRESPLLKNQYVKHIIVVGGPSIARVVGEVILKVVGFTQAQFFQTREAADQALQDSLAQTIVSEAVPGNELATTGETLVNH
jgi:hypothetical protein